MQFVVLPLFNEWNRFIPSQLSQRMLHNIRTNKAEWDASIQQAKEVSLKVTSSYDKSTGYRFKCILVDDQGYLK